MIRKYTPNDKSKLIELLRQNTPQFFDFSEEIDFENYLQNEIEDYYVFEENSDIIGAGGINYFLEQKLARISWDIVAPNSQGKGVGKQLIQHRTNHLRSQTGIEIIIVRTSQLAYQFYEKMGFELERIEKDFWAEGFDLYQMRMTNKS